MKTYLESMLAGTDGKPCLTRWMSLMSFLAGTGIAMYGIKVGKDMSGLAILVGVFVGAAFTGKVMQSSIENRNN